MNRPQPGDYNPFYETYIGKIGEGDIMGILSEQVEEIQTLTDSISIEKENYAYAEGKWTIKEVIGHLIDTERVMTYRALRFARNDSGDLRGFEQDDYVTNSRAGEREFKNLVDELIALRKANLFFFKSLDTTELNRTGTANGNHITVNGLLYIIAGHLKHHMAILKERYLAD